MKKKKEMMMMMMRRRTYAWLRLASYSWHHEYQEKN
jgi:hypothetical protein